MLSHYELYDPIRRSAVMEDSEFTKYVEICEQQTEPTSDALVMKLHDKFFAFARSCSLKYSSAETLWNFIGPKLKKNAGLAQFTLDYNGAKSEYFFPWLKCIFTSPARSLEMAYGAGYDLSGNWRTMIDVDDPINYFVMNDPTFVYNRERQLRVADLATTVQNTALGRNSTAKIVDFGAGMLAWTRWHGYRAFNVEIYAFDQDQSINPEELYDEQLDTLGIHYEHGDLFTKLESPLVKSADLIILGGVASYIPYGVFIANVLTPIHGLLNRGGTFFFDLQLDCPYLRRSMKLWDWPELELFKNATEAIGALEQARKKLWQHEMKFSAEYSVDTYNATPSALMITMTKVD